MTEKRFTGEIKEGIYHMYDNGELMGYMQATDLLNEQHETIQLQRKEIKSWIKYVHQLEAELRKYR